MNIDTKYKSKAADEIKMKFLHHIDPITNLPSKKAKCGEERNCK